MQKSLMDIEPSLVANSQPTVAVEPGKGAFNDPSMSTQSFTALYSPAGYSRNDAPLPQRFSTYSEVVRFISMQLHWSSAATTSAELLLDRFDSVNHFNEHLAIVDVCRRAHYREGYSLPVDHNMALRARFSF